MLSAFFCLLAVFGTVNSETIEVKNMHIWNYNKVSGKWVQLYGNGYHKMFATYAASFDTDAHTLKLRVTDAYGTKAPNIDHPQSVWLMDDGFIRFSLEKSLLTTKGSTKEFSVGPPLGESDLTTFIEQVNALTAQKGAAPDPLFRGIHRTKEELGVVGWKKYCVVDALKAVKAAGVKADADLEALGSDAPASYLRFMGKDSEHRRKLKQDVFKKTMKAHGFDEDSYRMPFSAAMSEWNALDEYDDAYDESAYMEEMLMRMFIEGYREGQKEKKQPRIRRKQRLLYYQ